MKVFKKFSFVVFILIAAFGCRDGITEYTDEVKTGDLIINSNPDGAEILFNNSRTGRITPDSLVQIQPGSYSITVILLGIGEETKSVTISPGKKQYVYFYIARE